MTLYSSTNSQGGLSYTLDNVQLKETPRVNARNTNDSSKRMNARRTFIENLDQVGEHKFIPSGSMHRYKTVIRHKPSGFFVVGVSSGIRSYWTFDEMENFRARAVANGLYTKEEARQLGEEAFEECWFLTDDIELAMKWDSGTSARTCFKHPLFSRERDANGVPWEECYVGNFLKGNPNFEIVEVRYSQPQIHDVEVYTTGKGSRASSAP